MKSLERIRALYDSGVIGDDEFISRLIESADDRVVAQRMLDALSHTERTALHARVAEFVRVSDIAQFDNATGAHPVAPAMMRGARILDGMIGAASSPETPRLGPGSTASARSSGGLSAARRSRADVRAAFSAPSPGREAA